MLQINIEFRDMELDTCHLVGNVFFGEVNLISLL